MRLVICKHPNKCAPTVLYPADRAGSQISNAEYRILIEEAVILFSIAYHNNNGDPPYFEVEKLRPKAHAQHIIPVENYDLIWLACELSRMYPNTIGKAVAIQGFRPPVVKRPVFVK